MPRDYWHCPVCNGNFDHGEKCDCYPKKPRLKVSDTYILGVDISADKDISCVQITRRMGDTCEVVNTLYGEEAEEMYKNLTGIKV
jgi:hypothetical protein